MDEAYRARQLQLIFAFGADRSDFAERIEDVALRTAMADVIQEINRLRIRNWCDNPADAGKYDITVIWLSEAENKENMTSRMRIFTRIDASGDGIFRERSCKQK